MKILYIADGRSPIARNWISHFASRGHTIHLVSLFPCDPDPAWASCHTLLLALTRASTGARPVSSAGNGTQGTPEIFIRRLTSPGLRMALRQWLVPLSLPRAARRLQTILAEVQPDLVHAMRIPFEGMLAALADPQAPLLVSVWGNDFTLHAPSTPLMARHTRLALRRADALHADCQRDLRLAEAWGFVSSRPTIVLPGGGGVQMDIFHPPLEDMPDPTPTVINPRGLRAYVHNETFFRAAWHILQHKPQTRFLCPAMAGAAEPQRWLARLGIEAAVTLLPPQTRPQMAELFRRSQVAVSPTSHDGTPNTLLEAMASGCYPVAGDLESLREWITPGVNGDLVDPRDPQALAEAVLTALDNPDQRRQAAQHNLRLIAERAEYNQVMAQAGAFYERLVTGE